MKNSLIALLISFLSISAWGAEISNYQDTCIEDDDDPYWCNAPAWTMKGVIEKGDYEKLKSILKKELISKLGWLSSQRLDFVNDAKYSISALEKFIFVWRPTISINSEGGDVIESMKIGRLIRQLRMTVSVEGTLKSRGKCLSACANIMIAGIDGLDTKVQGWRSRHNIGVHRPSFNDEYFAGLSSSEAEALYSKYEDEVKAYMVDMGASQALIDLTFNTPSSDIHMLKTENYNPSLITYASVPWWEERVEAYCSGFFIGDTDEICRTMLQVRDSLSSAKEYFK